MSSNHIADLAASILAKEPEWFYYDALNKGLPDEWQLKSWEELAEPQRQTIARHVADMWLWRTESKLDPNDVALRFEQYAELRALLA